MLRIQECYMNTAGSLNVSAAIANPFTAPKDTPESWGPFEIASDAAQETAFGGEENTLV